MEWDHLRREIGRIISPKLRVTLAKKTLFGSLLRRKGPFPHTSGVSILQSVLSCAEMLVCVPLEKARCGRGAFNWLSFLLPYPFHSSKKCWILARLSAHGDFYRGALIKCDIRESAVRMMFSQESVIKMRNYPNFSVPCMRQCCSNGRFSNGTFYRSDLRNPMPSSFAVGAFQVLFRGKNKPSWK